jgi:hypothetical protein
LAKLYALQLVNVFDWSVSQHRAHYRRCHAPTEPGATPHKRISAVVIGKIGRFDCLDQPLSPLVRSNPMSAPDASAFAWIFGY